MAYNLSLINSPNVMFLQKVHTKLSLDIDKSGKIPIKKYADLYIFSLSKVLTIDQICIDTFIIFLALYVCLHKIRKIEKKLKRHWTILAYRLEKTTILAPRNSNLKIFLHFTNSSLIVRKLKKFSMNCSSFCIFWLFYYFFI